MLSLFLVFTRLWAVQLCSFRVRGNAAENREREEKKKHGRYKIEDTEPETDRENYRKERRDEKETKRRKTNRIE